MIVIGPLGGASALRAEENGGSEARPLSAGDEAALLNPDRMMLAERLRLALGTRFEVLQPIAIGGMATIFQLRHRLHHGLFVAKVLHPGLADRAEITASFRAEAIHAAQLGGHPNIVPIYDLGALDGLFFMVMPYIEGEDLDHLFKRVGALPPAEALMLVAQISSALVYAEANGIAHCDLAPGNIRLDIFGQYRLLDFGLSRARDGGRRGASLGGTPAYTSPEQIAGEEPDRRSDLYALGLIFYEALVGSHPYPAATLDELAAKHLAGAWTLPENTGKDAADAGPGWAESHPGFLPLMKSMLETDRTKRMQSALELSGAVAALGCELPEFRARQHAEPRPPTAVTQTRKRRLTAL